MSNGVIEPYNHSSIGSDHGFARTINQWPVWKMLALTWNLKLKLHVQHLWDAEMARNRLRIWSWSWRHEFWIPENSAPRRTRPKPKLGPMEKSALRRPRPHGELGPPLPRRTRPPLRRTRPQLKFPTKCLFGQHGFTTLGHRITAFTSIHK